MVGLAGSGIFTTLRLWCKTALLLSTATSYYVLLCYKRRRRQQGRRGRDRARWVAMWRRRVAIEWGLCRSVLTGSASGCESRLQAG